MKSIQGKAKKNKINEYSIYNIKKESKSKRNINSYLVNAIEKITRCEDPLPKKSIIKFENTEKAANFNSKIIEACDYNYEKFISKQKDTTISYASEFRLVSKLRILLKHHKNWHRFEKFLTEGTDTVLSKMNNETLKNDCEKNIERGNHKSASKSKRIIEFLQKTYSKEVRLGWMIPISIESISKLKK